MKRAVNIPLHVLPLRGRPRLLVQGREVRLPKKGLALLYYLAVEGPASRARLADLLYGHASGLQNLRVELHRLGKALGRAVFPQGQDPLVLPGWVRLEPGGTGEVLEGLEGVGGLMDWVLEVRDRYASSPGAAGRQRLLEGLASLRPPFLLVLRGRLGTGQKAFARALAGVLGLAFHEALRPEGLVYLEPPYPPLSPRDLLRSRAFLVLRLDPGEEPRFFLELRAHYPPERLRVLELPPLTWAEARREILSGVPFPEAARAYLFAGGEPEWIPEWRACPEGPRRPLAQLRLQTRFLSEPARLALERLSVHPGRIPEEVLDALEAMAYLDELERKGFLVYQGGYRFAREGERRLLYAALAPGRRQELHGRAATALAFSGRPQEEALHRLALGEPVASLLPWPLRQALAGEGGRRRAVGLGGERVLLPLREEGVFAGEKGFWAALVEPGDEARLVLEPLEEVLVLEVAGQAYAPEDTLGLFLGLRASRKEGYVGLRGVFLHRFLAPPGPLALRLFGLGVAEFTLRTFRPRAGGLWALDLTAEEVEEQGKEEGKEQGRGEGDVHP
ncbi:hypothetical protein [Thermus islandicus]|uniref:hypothetical protein n=1 Tax=Thermus islandicus TaxID=540988 RepID=UPI0003B59558|nr:hypothetical protein [Thermus islandicus]